ncbi:MOSC domain protein, partial [Vibrio parahaemolyticus V-223/04]
SVKRLLKIS